MFDGKSDTVFEGATSAAEARQRLRGQIDTKLDRAFGESLSRLLIAWYGNYDGASKALGINRGTLSRYCTGVRSVPIHFLQRLVERRDRDMRARLISIAESREKTLRKIEARERIILAADEAGVAAIKARLERKDPTFVWTHLGYKPVDKAKPHPKRIRQKADGDE